MQMAPDAFREQVTNDPLFAAEGMDLERAHAALEALRQYGADLDRLLSLRSILVRAHLFLHPTTSSTVPLAFLESFLESERSRRVFLAFPTQNAAQQLLRTWRKAAREYGRAITRHHALYAFLKRSEHIDKDVVFADMFGNTSTESDIDTIYFLLKKNAETLEQTIDVCAQLLANTAMPAHSPSSKLLPEYVFSDMKTNHSQLHALEKAHASPFRYATIRESFGPIGISVTHVDGKPTPHQFTAYIVEDQRNHIRSVHTFLVDEYHFLDLRATDSAQFGRIGRKNFEPLIDRGIPYWYQGAGHLYATRDRTYEMDILTIFDSVRRPQLNRIALANQHSSMFDLVLGTCVDDLILYYENTEYRLRDAQISDHSYFGALLARGHLGIYFLPFNKSIWRLDTPLPLMGSGRKSGGAYHFKLLDEVQSELTDDTLRLVMETGRIRDEARKRGPTIAPLLGR